MKKAASIIKEISRATVDFYIQASIPKYILLQRTEELTDSVFQYKDGLSQRTGAYSSRPTKKEIEAYIRECIEKNA